VRWQRGALVWRGQRQEEPRKGRAWRGRRRRGGAGCGWGDEGRKQMLQAREGMEGRSRLSRPAQLAARRTGVAACLVMRTGSCVVTEADHACTHTHGCARTRAQTHASPPHRARRPLLPLRGRPAPRCRPSSARPPAPCSSTRTADGGTCGTAVRGGDIISLICKGKFTGGGAHRRPYASPPSPCTACHTAAKRTSGRTGRTLPGAPERVAGGSGEGGVAGHGFAPSFRICMCIDLRS
jgi:hypothetical protein